MEAASTLVLNIQRQMAPNTKNYNSRQIDVYRRTPEGKVQSTQAYSVNLSTVGSRIAVIGSNKYQDGLFDELRADAIVRVRDDVSIQSPVILERQLSTDPQQLIGDPEHDSYVRKNAVSMEVIRLEDSRGSETLQAGFIPGQSVQHELAKVLDNTTVRLNIADIRNTPPQEISNAPLA